MIPWWGVLIVLAVLAISHLLAILAGVSIAQSARDKADVAKAVEEKAKWEGLANGK